MGGGGGGWGVERWEGTLILPYIRRLGPFLGVKILNFNILGVFQKDEYFWGLWVGGIMMKLWIF